MNEIVGLGYVGIEARDLDAWEKFVCSLLGLQLAQKRDNGTLVFRLDDYAHRLSVTPGPSDDLAFIGWEVRDHQSLGALSTRLRLNGTTVTEEGDALATDRCVKKLISFRDPDGIRHEAFVGPLLQPQSPFVSPRSIGDFVTGDQGLGHAVLITQDIARQQRFFCESLGFRLSDYIDAPSPMGLRSFAFMRCSGRHHSLALAKIASSKKLAHLMFQTIDLDDVGLTYDLALNLGIPIAATLGRHTNDRMFSFYSVSPSGFEVEFGADALVVDDETWHVRTYDRTSIWGHVRTYHGAGTRNALSSEPAVRETTAR